MTAPEQIHQQESQIRGLVDRFGPRLGFRMYSIINATDIFALESSSKAYNRALNIMLASADPKDHMKAMMSQITLNSVISLPKRRQVVEFALGIGR